MNLCECVRWCLSEIERDRGELVFPLVRTGGTWGDTGGQHFLSHSHTSKGCTDHRYFLDGFLVIDFLFVISLAVTGLIVIQLMPWFYLDLTNHFTSHSSSQHIQYRQSRCLRPQTRMGPKG